MGCHDSDMHRFFKFYLPTVKISEQVAHHAKSYSYIPSSRLTSSQWPQISFGNTAPAGLQTLIVIAPLPLTKEDATRSTVVTDCIAISIMILSRAFNNPKVLTMHLAVENRPVAYVEYKHIRCTTHFVAVENNPRHSFLYQLRANFHQKHPCPSASD